MAKAQGATQIHHTPNDSDPGQWAGTGTSDYQDEHQGDVHIDENGTDYDGVKKALAVKVEKSMALSPAEVQVVKGNADGARAAIADKVSKGQRLTSVESWVLKGGYAKMKKMGMPGMDEQMVEKGNDKPTSAGTPGEARDAGSVPDSHAGENENDEIEPDAKKSFGRSVTRSQHLSKGIEMSPILAEFARATGEGLAGLDASVRDTVRKSLQPVVDRIASIENVMAKHIAEQGEFNKGFAETIVGIGQHVAGGAEVAQHHAQQPVGAPKSQLRAIPGGQGGAPEGVQAVQKSFGPGGLDVGGGALAKSQIVGAMGDLVEKGRLNSLDVIKFEMTGEISPQVQQMVMAHVAGGGQ
jgi:hypothetical protein